MIRSMTAFARREQQLTEGALTWELRAVNHRYLEISPRLPEEFRALEPRVREQVGRRLGRGKVECQLRFRPEAGAAGAIALNEDYLQGLIEACERVERLSGPVTAASALDLLRWPGVVREEARDMTPVHEQALALLDAALEELTATRAREGAQIAALIGARCDGLETLVAAVRERLPEVRARLRERLTARLAELDVEADPGRLEQELVIQLQKLDVDEELDRLAGHIVEVRRVLGREEPVGRRLDFLMQELNREANTLSSKSVDAETTRAAVDAKVLIEQMREQVQNVE